MINVEFVDSHAKLPWQLVEMVRVVERDFWFKPLSVCFFVFCRTSPWLNHTAKYHPQRTKRELRPQGIVDWLQGKLDNLVDLVQHVLNRAVGRHSNKLVVTVQLACNALKSTRTLASAIFSLSSAPCSARRQNAVLTGT